jgi:hypothetical protein
MKEKQIDKQAVEEMAKVVKSSFLQWAKEDGAKQHETQSNGSYSTADFECIALERSEREYKQQSKTAAEDPALLDRLKNVISG